VNQQADVEAGLWLTARPSECNAALVIRGKHGARPALADCNTVSPTSIQTFELTVSDAHWRV
jgi:hypothetical protein